MATLNTTLKQFIATATANADFQAFCTMIHNFFGTTCGFVQTSDTGQINTATVSYPGSNNTDAGSEFWNFSDSLQSTYPVTLKITYGRAGDANSMRLTFTVGMCLTNGSGIFMGNTAGSVVMQVGATGTRTVADTTAYRVSGSGAGGRAVLALFYDTVSTPRGNLFCIERTKNSDGTDNGDGLFAYHTNHTIAANSNSAFYALSFDRIFGGNFIRGDSWAMVYYGQNMATWGHTARADNDANSTLVNGKVYAFPMFGLHPGWKYPFMNMLNYCLYDFPTDYSTVSLPFYGSNHTYLPLGIGAVNTFPVNSNGTPMIRFE